MVKNCQKPGSSDAMLQRRDCKYTFCQLPKISKNGESEDEEVHGSCAGVAREFACSLDCDLNVKFIMHVTLHNLWVDVTLYKYSNGSHGPA
jgi:hypothetical protein